MMEMLVYHGSEDAAHGNINNEAISEKLEFPQLRSLNLNSLSNLVFFWSGLEKTCGSSLSDSPQPLFGEKVVFPSLKRLGLSRMNFRELCSTTSCMQNLSSLDVSSCPNLKYLFTFAMAGGLPQLETLMIRCCPVMEEVVVPNEHGEGRLEKNSFPKLKSLMLEDLPNLKRFFTGDCIECPSLLNLQIIKCGVLRKFISSNEEEVEGPFFNEKVSFPILEYLRLERVNLKILWADQLSITSFAMQNLRSLRVARCDILSHLFSLDVARSLLQLEELLLRDCKDMEAVLVTKEPIEEGTPQKISFPKLKKLELCNLQNIRQFCAGCCSEFPSLTKTEIARNPAISTFITDSCNKASGELMGSEAKQPLFNGKVLGPNLEELTTTSSKSMLTHLYEDSEYFENSSLESLKFLSIRECNRLNNSPLSSSTTSFQNLMALVVSECSSMINLLASSTAKTLVHLRLMSITECKQMTEIIADEIVDDEIVFGKLKVLELSELPSLRSFHSAGNSVMRFPNLVRLFVSQCPEMRRFSFGTIDAPKLDSISKIVTNKYRWDFSLVDESTFDHQMSHLPKPQQKLWEGDINKTIEKLWAEDYSLVMQRLFTET